MLPMLPIISWRRSLGEMRLHEKYGWEQQEPGWYTRFVKPNTWLGICQEKDGYWHLYGSRFRGAPSSFKSLKEAIEYVESEERIYRESPSMFA